MGHESVAQGCQHGDCDNRPTEGEKFCTAHGGRPEELMVRVTCSSVHTVWDCHENVAIVRFEAPGITIDAKLPACLHRGFRPRPQTEYEVTFREVGGSNHECG